MKTEDQKPVNAERSNLGVLIIAGEGLNPKYDAVDAITDIKVKSVLFDTSQKIAESLYLEIEKRGTKAQLLINSNPSIDTRTSLARSMAENKRDGLIQVMIKHLKNTSENTVYLVLSYNTLQFNKAVKGETLNVGNGLEEKYILLGKNHEGSNTPFTAFTTDFANKLQKAGYIGGK